MKNGTGISAVVLSAVIIASCATDRLHGLRKNDLACKTQESKYDYGKNLPVRAIKSSNRKYARFANRTGWNKNHRGYASKQTGRTNIGPAVTTTPDERVTRALVIKSFPDAGQYLYDSQPDLQAAPILSRDQPEEVLQNAKVTPAAAEIGTFTDPQESMVAANETDHGPLVPVDIRRQEAASGFDNEEVSETIVASAKATDVPDRPVREPFGRSETSVLLMALLAGLIPFGVIKAKPNLAANISFWAAMNPWKTRLMFAGVNTGLIAGGWLLGENLADNGIHFSDLSRYLLMGTFLSSSLLYPLRNTSTRILKHSWSKQKAFDLAVAVSGFMLMVNAGNDPEVKATLSNMFSLNESKQQYENTINDYGQAPKNLIYYDSSEIVQDDQRTAEEEKVNHRKKVGKTILFSLLAIFLGLLVAAAACGLSCNSMVGLAALTGIGGGVLLILFTVWGMRKIWGRKSERKPRPPSVTDTILTKGTFRV